MTRPAATWPPVPPGPPPLPPEPFPPQPPQYPRTPWHPEPRPPAPGSASVSVVLGAPDWLAERLFEQRLVTLAGRLDDDDVNRAVAELALLDARGDEPVHLRLSGVSADVGHTLTLVDALDLMGVEVQVTSLGTLSGAAVAVLAVAGRRTLGAHAMVHLVEPKGPRDRLGRDVEAAAREHARQLRRLQERLAEACGRDVEQIAADMREGRLLTAEEAREYGLIDT